MKTPHRLLVAGMLLATLGTGFGQPTISSQPQDQTNLVGTTAMLAVQATGAEPLAYQGQQAFDLIHFVDRPEGTNATLVITNVQTLDAGLYRAIVTNSQGAATSEVARLYVVPPPTLQFSSVPDAIPCTVSNAVSAKVVRIGLNAPGGTLIITNGGNLVCASAEEWNSIGMNNTGLMIVENGGSASFGNHLWIGFDPVAEGTLIMNGGTVSVGQMFGLGWNGRKGTALIKGGTLNLAQWNPAQTISGASVLDVAGAGKVVINRNHFDSISNYVSVGKITANGGPNVFYFYDAGASKTTISAVLLPAPRQAITAISVSGGDVTITYQTTHQHTYYIEGTPSLSPALWTPVVGSTNTATGGCC